MIENATPEMNEAADSLARIFADTWNRQDGPGYGAAYWPNAELVDPTGAIWDGRTAIAQMHVDLWHGPARDTRVAATVRRVRSLGSTLMVVDLAVAVSGFSPAPPGAATGSDGRVQTRLKHVVEKRGSEWKILVSQNTFVSGPPT